MADKDQNARLLKFLQATPQMLEEIDRILEGKALSQAPSPTGPLLCGMSAAATYLGVSRATLWRMVRAGRLGRVEVLPGSFRVRRLELEALVTGNGGAA